MAKNTLEELNDKLFAQLARLEDVDASDNGALMAEITRTKAVVDVARTIVQNADVVLRAHLERERSFSQEYIPPKMLKEAKDE